MLQRTGALASAVSLALGVSFVGCTSGRPKQGTETGSNSPQATTYRACGCGCCGGDETPTEVQCVTREEFDKVVLQDGNVSADDPTCQVVGCSTGTWYRVC